MNKAIPISSILTVSAMLTSCDIPREESAVQDDSMAHVGPSCSLDSFPALPDVRINSAFQEAAPVPHCKVAGVIGTEIHFELLLPDDWNGKFVMGGGGGFVGSVINSAQ